MSIRSSWPPWESKEVDVENPYQLAKSTAVNLLRGQRGDTVTRELIASSVDAALSLVAEWKAQVDRDELVRDLETQFSVWIGRSQTLEDSTDHKAWLPQKRGSIRWAYWERYREVLKETWPPASVDRLEELTDEILMRLEDPERPGPWDRRGLVVGHVQSGKTANYIGVINKAVDGGYRLIVVLAGTHKSLRSQTQIRLDEGFLGYESVAAVAASQGVKAIGVGRIAPGLRPNTITNRNDDGDFKRTVAERFQINPGGAPLLFVIKKNVSVLKNLLEWVEWAAGAPVNGRSLVRDVPLLVIDDEADNASVDTREQAFDENGEPDSDHDPTRINGSIRRLLHCFEKAAYVGYTATPFANIFIHEQGRTRDEGDDLFPRSFIVNLPAPSDYVGPLRVFGIAPQPETDQTGVPGLPIIRSIEDHAAAEDPEGKTGWMPPRHNKEHHPLNSGSPELPATLQEAVLAFILATAARRLRGQLNAHNSMLIHVTRFTAVQEHVYQQVRQFMEQLTNRLRWGEGQAPTTEIDRLKDLWERDFTPTSASIEGGRTHAWNDIAAELWNVASAIQIRRVNGAAPDILDYETHRSTGLSVIAIGGDKLARGLTLEGLTVSYFLRAAKMYDTLMQMGRWFGYRPGYLDLCRMYMTDELEEWFQHVTAANEELRQEFDRMAAVGGTPRDYGLKVRSHPALLITSNVKMKHGTSLSLTFAGAISETTVFRVDESSLNKNLEATERLVALLGNPVPGRPRQERPGRDAEEWKGAITWQDVPAGQVSAFLRAVLSHECAYKVQGRLMAEYIDIVARKGDMVSWTVALMGKEDGRAWPIGPVKVGLITRRGTLHKDRSRFTIQRLLSPRDEAIDLGSAAWASALDLTKKAWTADPARSQRQEPDVPSGPMIRQVRPKEHGLLLLYLIDNTELTKKDGEVFTLPRPLVGFAVSFPGTAARSTCTGSRSGGSRRDRRA